MPLGLKLKISVSVIIGSALIGLGLSTERNLALLLPGLAIAAYGLRLSVTANRPRIHTEWRRHQR